MPGDQPYQKDELDSSPAPTSAAPEPTSQEPNPIQKSSLSIEATSPMIDIHPAAHAASTWRDFLIHITTICIGLLIAIGLEQSIEALHRMHERETLRDSLNNELEQILRDSTRTESALVSDINWDKQAEEALALAIKTKHPVGEFPSRPKNDFDIPDNPVYKAAKASNKLELLSQQEVQAYGEMDAILDDVLFARRNLGELLSVSFAEEHAFKLNLNETPARQTTRDNLHILSGTTPSREEALKIQKSIIDLETAELWLRHWTHEAHGAATVIRQGERDLRKIQAAER